MELLHNYLIGFCETESTKYQNAMANFDRFDFSIKDENNRTIRSLRSYEHEDGSIYCHESFSNGQILLIDVELISK